MLIPLRCKQSTVVGLAVALLGSLSAAAGDLNQSDLSPSMASALQAELAGDNEGRDAHLRQLLRTDPDYSPTRWQSGFVEVDSQWVDFRDIPSTPHGLLEEYRGNRSRCGTKTEDLLLLADWCRDKGLTDAERAHLMQIIEQDPDHAAARERLGFIHLNGLWVSSDNVDRAAQRQSEIADSLEQWGTTIEQSVQLLSGGRRQQDRGRAQLFAIRDVSAIPAMEHLLAPSGERLGLLLIECLSQLDVYEASQAMARTALVTPHDRVRDAAAAALKSRSFDEYVPVLLGALKTPVELQSRAFINPQGWVVLELLFEAEAENEHRQLHWTTQVGKQVTFRSTGSVVGPDRRSFPFGFLKPSDSGDWLAARRYLLSRERQARQARLEWNETIRRTNRHAEDVLWAVTDHRAPKDSSAADWWDWWTNYNELIATQVKPTMRVQPDPERVYILDRDKSITDRPPPPRWEGGTPQSSGSCLVAGTPIWTDQGLIAVEQVQIGDRVLAQQLETGELAYKPVLATTVRPPVGTFVISTGGMTVRATGGHPFWVNGQGWRFARDLQPGMCLHGVGGSQPITSVEPAESAEAFNLIVADFHTYFIGDGQILSHDNTHREPTNALVPGLSRNP